MANVVFRRSVLARRALLARVGGALGAALFRLPAFAQPAAPTPPAGPSVPGEPYAPAGRRLVFTNWHWIRPGGFGWFDDKGNNVPVAGAAGPFDAQFRRFDQPSGIRIVSRPARRVGPVLRHERPWEGKGVHITTVLQERARYRAWGGCQAADGTFRFCCFESQDGLAWERPALGLVEFEGKRENNLLETNPGTVFVDPAAPEGERYKGVDLDGVSAEEFEAFKRVRPDGWEPKAHRRDVKHYYGIRGMVSADGLRWSRIPELLVAEHSDTQIVAYYDAALRKYVMYTRNYMIGARAEGAAGEAPPGWWGGDGGGMGRRSIGRTESADFRKFPLSEVILEPGPEMAPNDLLYTNCRTSIPGAPDHHLMFPSVWHAADDTTSIAFASSRDGRRWHYVPGGPVFRTAPFGEWDGGCVFARPNLVELPNGDFALPYTGYTFPHKYPRGQWQYLPGFAVWPKGRLVALEAAGRGEFATALLLPPGRKVRLNVVTQRAGSVRVEAAGENRAAFPGRSFEDATPIVGDRAAAPVTWKGQDDLGAPEGAPVMLRFRLDQAEIYGVEFA